MPLAGKNSQSKNRRANSERGGLWSFTWILYNDSSISNQLGYRRATGEL